MGDRELRKQHAGTFMGALGRDVRGNTLAIMAMALIPLAGMVGGGIDISRMYIVKTRLQHACDAAALAGRKAMGAGTWNQTGTIDGTQQANYPQKIARRYFDGNFDKTSYGGTDPAPQFIETGGKVSGAVSVDLPMTLMKIFGRSSETLAVTCEADMRLPNTDVMFVLDNTGSMGDTPSGDTQTKLQSLKGAVKCFYEIVARFDTTENCTTGVPSGGVGGETQVRFGFVLYSANVNVGKLLPTNYFADKWTFRSRQIHSIAYPTPGNTTSSTTTTWNAAGAWQDKAYSRSTTSNNCSSNVPATTTVDGTSTSTTPVITEIPGSRTVTSTTDTQVTKTQYRYDSYISNPKTCVYDKLETTGVKTTNYTRKDTAQVTWHYGAIEQDISGLKNGTTWNNSIQVRIENNGVYKTVAWDGCIAERATLQDIDFNAATLPSGAKDLDIDLVPSASDAGSLWGPVMKGMIYTPNGGTGSWVTGDQYSTTNYSNSSVYTCLAESRKLQEWKVPSTFETYVNSMTANGNTYHDIGLIWGARFASPTGIFKIDNATTPKGGEIQRHMIFMTDGDPCTQSDNYNAYGVAWFDRKQTATVQAPNQNPIPCTQGYPLTDQVNSRTQAICKEIKKKDITLWVITFGSVDPRTVTRMTTCASDGRYFSANNKADLQATFKKIADQISALRLTN